MRNIIQLGYNSEWALAKFLAAIFENGSSKYFNLVGVCGIEKDEETARKVLEELARKKENNPGNWRKANGQTEARTAKELISRLEQGRIQYYQSLNGDLSQISEKEFDAVVMTKNTTHLNYLDSLIFARRNILCEKPLVTVTNERHEADRRKLDRLDELIEQTSQLQLTLMDAEHYSAKKATIAFYDNIERMVSDFGKISRIEAITLEKDDPEKPRTISLLSTSNETGLMLDMGVHLIGIITNIDGEIASVGNTEYANYPGYGVETHFNANYRLRGKLFQDNATANIFSLKFLDKTTQDFKKRNGIENPEKDLKQFKVIFKKEGKETQVTLDFNEGTLQDSDGKSYEPSKIRPVSKFEYSNILREFHESIQTGKEPRTSFRRSAKTLDAIYRTYLQFPFNQNKIQVYQTCP